MDGITTAVIVFSYNRPKMLAEALSSIHGANEVCVVDDGSNFDADEVLQKFDFKRRFSIVTSQLSIEERMVIPRLGMLINAALENIQSDLVTYLCDDDLLDKKWIPIAEEYMKTHPDEHIVRGQVLDFFGNDLENFKLPKIDARGMVTGNFVHRMKCVRDEKLAWPENTTVNLDNAFLWAMHPIHDMWKVPFIDSVACLHRNHPKSISSFIGKNWAEGNIKKMLQEKWME